MKHILITGANRGLGLALTQSYLKSNLEVFACCRNPKNAVHLLQLQQQYPDHLSIYPLDVNEPSEINHLKTLLHGQSLDIVINNAGVFSIENLDPTQAQEPWLTCFTTNAVAPYLIAHAMKTNLAKGKTKRIVNISSYMASIALNQGGQECPYRASKAALNAITKNLALEFVDDAITCIAIDPGWVRTDMGGPNATLTAEESAHILMKTIQTLPSEANGKFFTNDGKLLAW